MLFINEASCLRKKEIKLLIIELFIKKEKEKVHA